MTREPRFLAECEALKRVLERYPTIEALHASPEWGDAGPRFARLLGTPRRHEPAAPPAPSPDPARVRAVHWNIEHGNWYDQVEDALLRHPDLRDADLLLFNEIDLGMARAGNRDVTSGLCRALDRHGVWAPLYLETTAGRDDDARCAGDVPNQEGLFGVAILSRWPIGEVRVLDLPSPQRIQFDLERMYGRHAALIATIERPGAPFVAVSVHLEVHRTRAHRTAQVADLLRALRHETRPTVIAGDFNSHTFDRGLWHAPATGAAALLLTPGEALRRRLLYPDRGPTREPLFDELGREGFEWERFVDREPTLKLRFDRLDEVRQMFGPARGVARGVLAWAEKRAKLRLDWFAGRGWRGGRGHTAQGLDGEGKASDHAPIVAEFE
ncbi:MAG: endonuclease/exonuclease/phosphatase family protein [Candidatus Eisenbacteria bacterium]|nr:endonuclease/exonuclease/phosphatase family protein [Candidatus Eisenbacteria bacterium]